MNIEEYAMEKSFDEISGLALKFLLDRKTARIRVTRHTEKKKCSSSRALKPHPTM